MNKLRLALTPIILISILLTGCKSTPPTPTPAELLAQGAKDLQALTSLKFTLTREGEPVTLDEATGAKFTEAAGEYQAPDKVHAKVKIQAAGTVLSLDLIWLPDAVYASNPFTGSYAKADPPPAFNAAAIFGADGLPGVLQTGMSNVTLVGAEKLDDVDTNHLRGETDGAKLKVLTGGVIVEGQHTVDVWIEKATTHILRLHDAEPGGDGKNGWMLDLSDFNKPVEIKAP